MLLLDDESRDALQCLLYLLHDIANGCDMHKMDAKNIATCLAPTLINMSNLKEIKASAAAAAAASAAAAVASSSGATGGGAGATTSSISGVSACGSAGVSASMSTSTMMRSQPALLMAKDTTNLMHRQCNASLNCLTLMISNPKCIFQIPVEAYNKCQLARIDYSLSSNVRDLIGMGSTHAAQNAYLNEKIEEMTKVRTRTRRRRRRNYTNM